MRLTTIATAALTVLALTAGALAAPTANDPSRLILQQKDFPAHSDYDGSPGADGFDLKTALSAANVDAGLGGYVGAIYSERKGLLTVRGAVITTASVVKAKQAFDAALKGRQKFWKLLGAKYAPFAGVPKYGDQQLAFAKQPSVLHDGSIDLFVRKRAVVWVLEVLVSDRRPPPTMAEIVVDLKTYAAKQQSRIGAG